MTHTQACTHTHTHTPAHTQACEYTHTQTQAYAPTRKHALDCFLLSCLLLLFWLKPLRVLAPSLPSSWLPTSMRLGSLPSVIMATSLRPVSSPTCVPASLVSLRPGFPPSLRRVFSHPLMRPGFGYPGTARPGSSIQSRQNP
eukprot:GHVU01188785.1.p1 GENE.GHVU01188785.1~~GHVU01188785.1.p1  ORF type:complete len:142 (+),score=1.93 GHVU01188785.1:62-487(+)